MRQKHLLQELQFYSEAFIKNKTRRKRKFSWETTPSKVLVELIKKHRLDKKNKGKKVLDLGCGDGRHSEYFIKLGYEIVGVDFCKEAIEICKKKFKDKKAKFYRKDLTQKGVLDKLGKFDIIFDWSVLDHIREKYKKTYKRNILKSLAKGGHLILTEFSYPIPGLFKNRKYKVIKGHYSKAYLLKELIREFAKLKVIDKRENILEDKINNYRFNTIILEN